MPRRNSMVHIDQSVTLRRSTRLLNQIKTSKAQPPWTPQGPEYPKSFNSRSRKNRVCKPDSSISSVKGVFVKPVDKDSTIKISKKTSVSHSGSRNFTGGSTGLRKSPRLNNGVDSYCSLRRSSRICSQKDIGDKHKIRIDTSGKPDNNSGNFANLSSCSTKSSRLKNGAERFQCLRRSQRISSKQNIVVYLDGNDSSSESSENTECDSDDPTERANTGVGRTNKVDVNLSQKSEKERKTMPRKGSAPEAFTEGEEARNDGRESEENRIKRKRKRGEDAGKKIQGWTVEQERALQRAYFATKPTPHFWKKVSKLVPGKSAHDCFDKVHSDHLTPPQPQPRSRAKKMKSSPLKQFSLSASKLLKPTEKKARSSFVKMKSYLRLKSVRELIKSHHKLDQDHQADLFYLLEPNMDISCTASQPSVLSTPDQLQEKQGLLQKCSERSSLSHKKPLSRFSSSCETDLVSPPVLKQVKNRVLHEKYIDQLHSREARRKAASVRVEMSTAREKDRQESNDLKSNVVRAAKIALVSEARDTINKFQQSQANFMSNSYNYDDDENDVGVESGEFESQ
ncbi:putative Homeodomain-like superfamily protein [Quillaja saponaria]|uniref:Homeodomain-like superfamily protein n=1 Tax=Quillaja saponaria TaxID=32244 RepID=A0AAD7KQG5_QUISA|nr:putative Homeodomain-like superfamily protein [Quillaja saponaria]